MTNISPSCCTWPNRASPNFWHCRRPPWSAHSSRPAFRREHAGPIVVASKGGRPTEAVRQPAIRTKGKSPGITFIYMPETCKEPSLGELRWLTLSAAAQLVRKKEISPVELTQTSLDLIEQLNPTLNAFITVTAESALSEARAAEREIQNGNWRGPLHGIPIALKDLFDTAGVRTTAASALFQERVPAVDCEVARRLRAAGAVLLGKLNMHEFAYGGSSVISCFGPVRNPWSREHIAGGSSAGSAAAVAAGL